MTSFPGGFVVHYHELALKGRNRPWFISTLVRRLRDVTSGLGVREVRAFKGRVEVLLNDDADATAVAERLRASFGVANFARSVRCPASLDAILAAVASVLPDAPPSSFRVRATRGDKRFPLTSPEIERRVGAFLHERHGWPVNLSRPDLTVHVEVLSTEAFCTGSREAGPGGLPVGTGGRVLALVSGGLDSPVAAWRIMRRGCRIAIVHFHSAPLTSARSQVVVRNVTRRLARYQGETALVMVPFAEIQRHVVAVAPSALRTVLYRRLMVRLANAIAPRLRASALVTGDVLGQVASQTLENLAVVDHGSALPVLRPLVGSDKEEISTLASMLGTFPWSVNTEEDCCAVYQPRQPATRARLGSVLAVEKALDLDRLVAGALEAATHDILDADWADGEPIAR